MLTFKRRCKSHNEKRLKLLYYTYKPKKEYKICISSGSLELQSSTLLLLITTKLKVLASLQWKLHLSLANNTLQSQHNLLGSLGLLSENLLSLTTETSLLSVISSLTLSVQGSLTSLVLCNSVLGVLSALLALAVSLSGLWNVNYKIWGSLLVFYA